MYVGQVKPYVPPPTEVAAVPTVTKKPKLKAIHRDKNANKHESKHDSKHESKHETEHDYHDEHKHEDSKIKNTDYEAKSSTKVKKKPTKTSKASSSKKKASSKAKESLKTFKTPLPYNDAKVLPDPHPDISISTPTVSLTSISASASVFHSIHSGILPVVPTHNAAFTSGFSPLPPLAAAATSLGLTTTSLLSTSPTASTLGGHQGQTRTAAKHVSTAVIVLLAVGAAFLLVGIFLVFKMCYKPRKHIPTPSLPILQDPFDDEKQSDPEEESLFGGKERTSARPGSNTVLLPWTQYPHTSVIKPAPTLDANMPWQGDIPKRASLSASQKAVYTTPRTPHRVSAMSVSVYPGSPMSLSGNNVGLAIGGSPLAADGPPVIQHSKPTTSARRMSKAAKAARQSMVISDRLLVPNDLEDSDLYAGSTYNTPALPPTSAGGRARVKAPYAPNSLLRASATLSGVPAPPALSLIDEPNPFEESQYVLPPISPMMKSDDRRERDTKALTSALGLSSPNPMPLSPQTTVYPDDSITLAGDRRRSRRYSQGRVMSVVSQPTEASARLGKLMMGEFQSMTSLPSNKAVANNAAAGPSTRTKPVTRKRVEELPPRVPSPPPLPSLAQMALAHTNLDDYETYRSPTYSIYGLYEADRKSKN
ncbi:hypothetical protein EIP86_010861 [Pleurotus ostreatoroseus]|nr:hypothetical protein EIP86_010861 [Pleurotus ostreatoroseus]